MSLVITQSWDINQNPGHIRPTGPYMALSSIMGHGGPSEVHFGPSSSSRARMIPWPGSLFGFRVCICLISKLLLIILLTLLGNDVIHFGSQLALSPITIVMSPVQPLTAHAQLCSSNIPISLSPVPSSQWLLLGAHCALWAGGHFYLLYHIKSSLQWLPV